MTIIFVAPEAQQGEAPSASFPLTETITSATTDTAIPITFGHIFKQGDIPTGQYLDVTGMNNVYAQVKSTHADGSANHVIVSGDANVIADTPKDLTLSTTTTAPSGTALTKANLLATSYDFDVSIVEGATTYTLDARDLLDGTITPMLEYQHLSSPQCSEWIIGGFIRNGGTPHSRLMMFFHIRYYATGDVRTIPRLENTTTLLSKVAYTLDVTYNQQGTAAIYTNATGNIESHGYAGGSTQEYWWPTNNIDVYCEASYTYISECLGLAYQTITPDTTALNGLTQTVDTFESEIADLRTSWGTGGSSPQLALFPQWDAFWFVSGDERAYNATLTNADALGSYSCSYRDESTGYPPILTDYSPTLSITTTEGGIPDNGSTSSYTHNRSHQPLIGLTSYILSGDYSQLENLMFMANYNLLFASSSKKNGSNGEFLRDNDYELRGGSWGIRTLGACAWICPDDHSLKTYLNTQINNNLTYHGTAWHNNESYSGYKLGIMEHGNGSLFDNYPFWQHAFRTGALGFLADIGFNKAIAGRNYCAKWYRGLWDSENDVFPYQLAPENRRAVGSAPGTAYQTFEDVANEFGIAATPQTQAFIDEVNAEIGGGFITLTDVNQCRYSTQNDSYWGNQALGLFYAMKSGLLTGRAGYRHALAVNQPSDFNEEPQYAHDVESIVPYRATNSLYNITADTSISADASTNLKTWDSGHDISTYSGACFNPIRGYYQAFGGGHGDGQSVNVAVLDMQAASAVFDHDYTEPDAIYSVVGSSYFDRSDWADIFDPTNYPNMIFWPKPTGTFAEAADAKAWYPVSRHTYALNNWIGYTQSGKPMNKMLMMGGSSYRPSGDTIPNNRYEKHPETVHLYDHVTKTWDSPGVTPINVRALSGSWSPYDGYYYLFSTLSGADGGIWKYDFSKVIGGWEKLTFNNGYTGVQFATDSIEHTSAYVHRPTENPFIVIRLGDFTIGDKFYKYDLVNSVVSELSESGATVDFDELGMFYDHITDLLWACENTNGGTGVVYTYNFDTNVWTQKGSMTYSVGANHGMHNTFQFDPVNRVGIALYRNSGSVYKLPDS